MKNPALAEFLAHSVELESEAQDRYGELADAMEGHHNREVAAFFRRMAEEAEHHLMEVTELAGDMVLPQLKAWDYDWPGTEPPETADYESVHYRMSLRQARAPVCRGGVIPRCGTGTPDDLAAGERRPPAGGGRRAAYARIVSPHQVRPLGTQATPKPNSSNDSGTVTWVTPFASHANSV
jgi:hypothetical protein